MTVVIKNPPANAGDGRYKGQPPGQEDPLEEEMAPTPVFLPGKSDEQRTLEGYSLWGSKELDTTEQLSTYTDIRGGAVDRNPPASAGDRGSSPGLERFPVPWSS